MRRILEWRPELYTELCCASSEHSGLAWGAILRQLVVLSAFPRLPCSSLREHVPIMDFSPRQQRAFRYGLHGPSNMDFPLEIYGPVSYTHLTLPTKA